MKIESHIEIASAESRWEFFADGSESAVVHCGGVPRLSIGRIKTGNFDESLGLAEKLRRHLSNDGLCAETDSENVIPFGCEYRVRRHWKFSGNVGELTDDISADNGGRINDLQLEPVRFTGAAAEVAVLFDGEAQEQIFPASGVIYDGEKLPLCVRVTFKDGAAAEFYCGDDFWRHRCASAYPGGIARHTITADADGVTWVRHVLAVPEDVEVEKRPWRFKMLLAVTPQAGKTSAPECGLDIDGCMASGGNHRQLRTFVRKQTDGAVPAIRVSGRICCNDGSHVARPGKKVDHGMLGEIFDEYLWANGVMARKNGSCIFDAQIDPLPDSLIAANLRQAPQVMEFTDLPDDEEEL